VVEVAPENAQDDERLRNIVIERNFFQGTSSVGNQILVSGVDIALRNNIFIGTTEAYGIQVTQRGIEPAPTGIEAYNNSCYSGASSPSTTACVYFNSTVSGSDAKNNLAYYPNTSNPVTVSDNGTNTVANNSANAKANPNFTTQPPVVAADFKPTAGSYAIGAGALVPVWSDFFGLGEPTPRDVGAVAH